MCVFSTHYTFLVSVSYYYLGLQSVSFVDTLPHNKLVSEPRSYDLGILNIFFWRNNHTYSTIHTVLFIRLLFTAGKISKLGIFSFAFFCDCDRLKNGNRKI